MGPVTTPSDPLRLRVRIDAQPDAVYKSLTDPDAMTEWLADSAEVDLDGGKFEFWGRYTPLGDRARQTLWGAEPNRSLRFDWELGGEGDVGGAGPGAVEISLDEHPDGGTVVTVTHTGVSDAQRLAVECFWPVTLANLAAHSEGLQTMPPFDFSAPAQDVALARTVIDVPAEEVYAYLLEPAHVDGPDGGRGEIVEQEPEKLLAYSWRSPRGPDTVVRWQLRTVRGSTYLTLVQEGFTDDAVAERYRQGWPPYLVELKRRLELGPRFEPLRG
jgi:uncharacterized protein YndB with AHSA1/START domain